MQFLPHFTFCLLLSFLFGRFFRFSVFRLLSKQTFSLSLNQRCQMIFFKSARSDVKIRPNPPSRIGQIRQKSARNWDDFKPFFTLREVFVGFLVRILPYLRSVP
jgi:hypothetical protein